ncbi:MAG: MoxR family ATPase [Planctomycetota bacterium]
MGAEEHTEPDAGTREAAEAAEPAAGRTPSQSDIETVKSFQGSFNRIRDELHKVIVGQDEVIEELLIAIFSRGHGLLVGVPGLAKTMMVSTLADALSLSFNRIQFTPDLMPSDITGTEVIQQDKETGQRHFRFLPGPLFAHVILADEVNRTPPKTQAALLEAMQERQVTVGGEKNPLPDPFFVLATQNPIEQEGTYPLPEAQLDRFMFEILVDYPEEEEEYEILRLTTAEFDQSVDEILAGDDILRLQSIVRRVPIAEHVIRYAMAIARKTRVHKGDVPDFVTEWVTWGAGPRAGQYMILGGKARAILRGRYYVSCEDIASVAHPVLRHRIITNFNAEAEGVSPDDIVDRLLEDTPSDESALLREKSLPDMLEKEGGSAAE